MLFKVILVYISDLSDDLLSQLSEDMLWCF